MIRSHPRILAHRKRGLGPATLAPGQRAAATKGEIHVLLLEDNAIDVDLIRRALRAGGMAFRFSCVDTKSAFVHQLSHAPPDVILSDYTLPSFDGSAAL